MRKFFFILAAMFAFSLANVAFSAELTAAQKASITSRSKNCEMQIAQTVNAHHPELLISEVSIRRNSAQIHFQPGPVKYVAEYKEKKTVLVPQRDRTTFSNVRDGFLGIGNLQAFRFASGGYDELWLTIEEANFNEDIIVKVTGFFEYGTSATKEIRIIKGEPRIISIGEKGITLALKRERK